jgi:hypothetical protein
MTIFDCLKDIITTKSQKLHLDPDFKKVWSSFMITRYLSMDKRFADLAFDINKYQMTLTSEQLYLTLCKIIPKQNNSFIKYISKPKKEKVKKEDSEEESD